MAFDITNLNKQAPMFVPTKVVQVTDATATTTTQGDLGASLYRHFRATVACSSYTEPDGNAVASAGSSFALEVSNSSNFDAANAAVYQVDARYIPANGIAASVKPVFVLQGTAPDLTLYRYTRIVFAGGTNGAVNFDAVIEAA